MSDIAQRITDRLPRFYNGLDKTSTIATLVDSISLELKAADEEITNLIRAHWVDTAGGGDLDDLAIIVGSKRLKKEDDEHFRGHLKRAVDEFKGGGTISAILKEFRDFVGGDEISILENPPVESFSEFVLIANDTWKLGSNSIEDEQTSLSLTVEGVGEISNPKITNIDTDQSIAFKGKMKTGQQLIVNSKGCTLDGVDINDKVTLTELPKLLRRGSTWKYSESLLEGMGVFDKGKFDKNTFAVGVPTVRVRFDWIRRQPATFLVQIKKDAISSGCLNESQCDSTANYLKAAGTKVIITVME